MNNFQDSSEPSESFWNFSLAVYGRGGLATAAIALQDRLGADVNVLLLCCWAGHHGADLDLDLCMAQSKLWQDTVVTPLRRARRTLKTRIEAADAGGDGERAALRALRQQIVAAEREAERLEQTALARLATPTTPAQEAGLACAARHLIRYASRLESTPSAQSLEDLTTVLTAAFDLGSSDDARRALMV